MNISPISAFNQPQRAMQQTFRGFYTSDSEYHFRSDYGDAATILFETVSNDNNVDILYLKKDPDDYSPSGDLHGDFFLLPKVFDDREASQKVKQLKNSEEKDPQPWAEALKGVRRTAHITYDERYGETRKVPYYTKDKRKLEAVQKAKNLFLRDAIDKTGLLISRQVKLTTKNWATIYDELRPFINWLQGPDC